MKRALGLEDASIYIYIIGVFVPMVLFLWWFHRTGNKGKAMLFGFSDVEKIPYIYIYIYIHVFTHVCNHCITIA